MGHFKINQKEIFFILKEQLNYGSLCALPAYRNLNEKTLDMLVSEAVNFAKGVMDPLQTLGENPGPVFEQGQVRVPPEFGKAFRQAGQNGWVGVDLDEQYGGQGFPSLLTIVKNDIMYGACQGFNMAPSLTRGAAHLIESFAEAGLKEKFLSKMLDGTWSGTMCLTEPECGSNLADITTRATPAGGRYKISGTKVFISWGDHDMTENIVHMVLARIDGAPQGVKGLSLFIVPKYRLDENGKPAGSNDVACGGMEEKLGIHSSPTCTLNFGAKNGCEGYLCGRENNGLAHMFQMMNASRINTGVAGLGAASSAYLNAAEYAKTRLQGRDIARRKEGNVPIIDHPDVRRMLLWMKIRVDGMRSLAYSGMYWADLSKGLPDGEEKDHYRNLLEFLTPIIKSFCSDTAFRVCETAMQVYGGYGYSREYPQEQYLRDVKILSLYEGTNGIQAMDLMGRKMGMNGGAPWLAFQKEISSFCEKHGGHRGLGDRVRALKGVMEKVCEAVEELKSIHSSDVLLWASHTTPALSALSELIMVWRLLDMAAAAWEPSLQKGAKYDFYRGKVMQAAYCADTSLPNILAGIQSCLRPGREVVEFPESAF